MRGCRPTTRWWGGVVRGMEVAQRIGRAPGRRAGAPDLAGGHREGDAQNRVSRGRAGSRQSGSSWRASLTARLTGARTPARVDRRQQRVAGPRRACGIEPRRPRRRARGSPACGRAGRDRARGRRRHDRARAQRLTSSPSRGRQDDHSPANANGSPPGRVIQLLGCRPPTRRSRPRRSGSVRANVAEGAAGEHGLGARVDQS